MTPRQELDQQRATVAAHYAQIAAKKGKAVRVYEYTDRANRQIVRDMREDDDTTPVINGSILIATIASNGAINWLADYKPAELPQVEPSPRKFPQLDIVNNVALSTVQVIEVETRNTAADVPRKLGEDKALALARLFAAAPALYEAGRWASRCASFKGPVGTTLYAISDEKMAELRAAVALVDGLPPIIVPKTEHPPLRSLTEAQEVLNIWDSTDYYTTQADGAEYAEAQSKGIEGWQSHLKTALYSVDTLQVEVPASISAASFDPTVEDYCSRKGYDGLDGGGIVIEAADLPGIIESDPVDEQIATFFKEVERIKGNADRLYFHRADAA